MNDHDFPRFDLQGQIALVTGAGGALRRLCMARKSAKALSHAASGSWRDS